MKAVVYDKWLHSLGGGEVVACNIAKILKDLGYKVRFICSKKVPIEIIKEKMNIDLSGIEFVEVWNDETDLKKKSQGSDLFINASFMDYSWGFGKKNIYYTHFPTKAYKTAEDLIFSKIIIPFTSRFIKPIESMSRIDAPTIVHGLPAFELREKNKFAISILETYKVQTIEFKLCLETFYKTLLENIELNLENAEIIEKIAVVSHHLNVVKFKVKFKPFSETIYLTLNFKENKTHDLGPDKIFLLYPKINIAPLSHKFFHRFIEKITNRLRAGFFINVIGRLNSYQVILANSYFTKKWIKNYWGKNSEVLYPPVELLYKKYKLENHKKNNWICSVGRFFTLGHGKKQEIMIDAFKKIYDSGTKDWELHLIGGLGTEPTSIKFFSFLKDQAKGYPIFFHPNISKADIEKIYLKSKIYWHAAGYGENEGHLPIKFEHFGISVIEAVSAGCIPILYKGGGLREIVEIIKLDANHNLFKNQEELIEHTSFFMDQEQQIPWEEIHKILEGNFSKEAFEAKFKKIISN